MIFEPQSKNRKILILISAAILLVGGAVWYARNERPTEQGSFATTTAFGDVMVGGLKVEIDPDLQLEVFSVTDQNNKPEVFDIGWQWVVGEHAPGGIIIRGTWDKNEDGIFIALPEAEKFARIKDAEGAPTPYFTTGNKIYIFKTGVTEKKDTLGRPLPTPFLIVDADPQTFVPGLGGNFNHLAKDKNRVYIQGVADQLIDPATLVVIKGWPEYLSYFFKDKNHVYDLRTDSGSRKPYTITPYDPTTFQIFEKAYGYTKDKNGVYYEDKKITGADTKTFDVITDPPLSGGKAMYATYSYSKDAANVYFLGELVAGADPKTFVAVDMRGLYSHYYGKDGRAVFEGTTTLPFLDPKTFKPLWFPIYEGCGPSKYVRDATRVLYEKEIVPGADPETFEPLINGYGKDKRGIYKGIQFDPALPMDFKPVCDYG